MLFFIYIVLITFEYVKPALNQHVNSRELESIHWKNIIAKQLLKRKLVDLDPDRCQVHLAQFLKNGDSTLIAGPGKPPFLNSNDDPSKKQTQMSNAFIASANLLFGAKFQRRKCKSKEHCAPISVVNKEIDLDLESLKHSYSGFNEENNDFSSSKSVSTAGIDRKRTPRKKNDPISCYLSEPKKVTCTHDDKVYKILLPREGMGDEEIGRIVESIYNTFERRPNMARCNKKRTSNENLNLAGEKGSNAALLRVGNGSKLYFPVLWPVSQTKDPELDDSLVIGLTDVQASDEGDRNREDVRGFLLPSNYVLPGVKNDQKDPDLSADEEKRRNWLALMATNGLVGIVDSGGRKLLRNVRMNVVKNSKPTLLSKKPQENDDESSNKPFQTAFNKTGARSTPKEPFLRRRLEEKKNPQPFKSDRPYMRKPDQKNHQLVKTMLQNQPVVNCECRGCPCPKPCSTTPPSKKCTQSTCCPQPMACPGAACFTVCLPPACPTTCSTKCTTTCPTTKCTTTCPTTRCTTTCSTTKCARTTLCCDSDMLQWPRLNPKPCDRCNQKEKTIRVHISQDKNAEQNNLAQPVTENANTPVSAAQPDDVTFLNQEVKLAYSTSTTRHLLAASIAVNEPKSRKQSFFAKLRNKFLKEAPQNNVELYRDIPLGNPEAKPLDQSSGMRLNQKSPNTGWQLIAHSKWPCHPTHVDNLTQTNLSTSELTIRNETLEVDESQHHQMMTPVSSQAKELKGADSAYFPTPKTTHSPNVIRPILITEPPQFTNNLPPKISNLYDVEVQRGSHHGDQNRSASDREYDLKSVNRNSLTIRNTNQPNPAVPVNIQVTYQPKSANGQEMRSRPDYSQRNRKMSQHHTNRHRQYQPGISSSHILERGHQDTNNTPQDEVRSNPRNALPPPWYRNDRQKNNNEFNTVNSPPSRDNTFQKKSLDTRKYSKRGKRRTRHL